MNTQSKQWTEQANEAIRQGQSLNNFVLSAQYGNRANARKGYLKAIKNITKRMVTGIQI